MFISLEISGIVGVRTFGLSLKQSQASAMSCFSRSVSSFLGSMLEELLEFCGIARV